MTMFCLVLVNFEASAEINSDQTLLSTETETEQNEIPEICHQVSAKDLDYYKENRQAFFDDIQFIPVVSDNYMSAYIINFVKEGSPVNNYSPETSNEITHINNKPVRDIENLITAFSLIKDGHTLKLSIINKQGIKMNYKYLFNPQLSCSDTDGQENEF